eukprot:TRINITY_DN727_c0_g2_i1.p1 TRINITY_DN727_c0_g2~~TRINITY_DN727_c0_g2_i1.p1  ORF type:complete len:695 (+),score=162.99 TRINITY_DN727_c0_g2_i1:154-2238(+)
MRNAGCCTRCFSNSMCCVFLLTVVFVVFGSLTLYALVYPPLDRLDKSHASTFKDVVVFTQLSDIHLRPHDDEGRTDDFAKFVQETIAQIIRPDFGIVTGDITDQQTGLTRGTTDGYEDVWKKYKNVLESVGYYNKTKWIDLRGNHETLTITRRGSEHDYFHHYGVWGGDMKTRVVKIPREFGEFVVYDPTPSPGISTPLNFFGVPTKETLDDLDNALQDTPQNHLRILLMHYPRTSMNPFSRSKKGDTFSEVLDKHDPMFSLVGHNHQVGMFSRFGSGHIELELGDFRDKRMMRIGAIDHGILSFSDQKFDEFPVILVSNPADARFLLEDSHYEEIERSNEVRCFVFSKEGVDRVEVKIDGGSFQTMTQSGTRSTLYTCPWDPASIKGDLRELEVRVVEKGGHQTSKEISFSVDGSIDRAASFPSSVAQKFNMPTIMLSLFIVLHIYILFVCIILPWAFRTYKNGNGSYESWKARVLKRAGLETGNGDELGAADVASTNSRLGFFSGVWVQLQMYLMKFAEIPDKVRVVLFIMFAYPTFGPIIMGPISDDRFGAIFIWGVALGGETIWTADPMVFFFPLYLMCFLPFVHFIGRCYDREIIQTLKENMEKSRAGTLKCCACWSVGFLFAGPLAPVQLFFEFVIGTLFIVLTALGYTFYGMILSFGITWPVVIAFILTIRESFGLVRRAKKWMMSS